MAESFECFSGYFWECGNLLRISSIVPSTSVHFSLSFNILERSMANMVDFEYLTGNMVSNSQSLYKLNLTVTL